MSEGEKNKMVHCPYNFSHVLLKSRLPAHLIKCRPHHLVEKYTTCPFNSTHDVPALELEYHVQTCPDRKNLENYVYVIGDSKQQELPPQLEVPGSSENWDEEEVQRTSYLEVKDKKLENEKLFRVPVGMTKKQKKDFTQNEILKFGKADRLQENSAGSGSVASRSGSSSGSRDATEDSKKSKKKERSSHACS